MKKIAGLLKSQTLKDSGIIFIGLGVTAIIGFIFTVILARVIGPVQFGIYSAISALATIIYSLGDLGISSSIINLLPKKVHSRYLMVSTGFWLQFFVAIFALLVMVVFALFRRFIIPGSLQEDLILAGGITVNYLFIGYAQGVFTAEKKFWFYSFSQIIDSGIKIILVLLLFKFNRLNIGSALAANFISTIFSLLITFGKELYKIEFDISQTVIQEIIKFARWIAVSRIFSVLISRVDVILLNAIAGSYQAGIYSAAARVSLLFALLVSGLGSVVNPRFSSFNSKLKVVTYIKKLLLFIVGISLVMVICALLADPIIRLVYGASYLSAVPVFRYLTLAMIPFLFSLVTTPPILYTFNCPDYYAKITALQVSLIIILDLLLIPLLGPLAPVIAMGITNILVVILSSIKLRSLMFNQDLQP